MDTDSLALSLACSPSGFIAWGPPYHFSGFPACLLLGILEASGGQS